MNIRKDDNILVISGKDRGKKGKVRFAYPRDNKVIVEGLNMVKKSLKRVSQTQQGGIIERAAPLSASNVMYLCQKCNKPSRLGSRTLKDGRKVRFCRACNEVVN